MLSSSIKKFIKNSINAIGFDIMPMQKSPKHSLLGLRHLPIHSIIDVGANTGQFARHISTLFPGAHVFCFEPLPGPYKELNHWAKGQKHGKVTALNIALGAQEGTLEMYCHVEHSPSSSFLRATNICKKHYPFTQKQVSIPVKLMTLDKWITSLTTHPVPETLIKLDVQGYEERVIRGGQKIFTNARACIVEICLDKLYGDQASFKDISTLLYELGFDYAGNIGQFYGDDGHVIFIDALFIKKRS